MLDSVVKIKKKYFLQPVSEEPKFEIKNNKMENCLNDDLDNEYSRSNRENLPLLIQGQLSEKLKNFSNFLLQS